MQLKKLIWPLLSLIVIVVIYFNTGAVAVLQINWLWFLLAIAAFFLSTVFWAFAWASVFSIPFRDAVYLNTKALLGIFTPANVGGDALRAYFAAKKNYSSAKALASSLVVKFFKFILMGLLLTYALFFISGQLEFPQFSLVFLLVIIFTFTAAILVLLLSSNKLAFIKNDFITNFQKHFRDYFSKITFSQVSKIVFWLLVSTSFEIASVALCFSSLGIQFSLLGIFIVGTIVNSFSVAAITPQGIGIVEAGGYFVLSFSMFYMTIAEIGSFLILWGIIRVWVPIILGLIFTAKK